MPVKKAKAVAPAPAEPIRTYGCPEPWASAAAAKLSGANLQFFFDQHAFAWRNGADHGVPPRKELFKRIASKLCPGYFEWHDWTDKLVETVCENKWIGIAGCGGSAKTHNIAGFACLWWLCAPLASSVIFCSTTAKALRKRGWAQVQAFRSGIPVSAAGPGGIGNFVNSQMVWSAVAGDDKHAITGIAVEEGQTAKVADNIKGVHTQRQMVIIDEATAVPPAIFDACTNLYSFPEEFIMVMLGNPRSRLDEFGKWIEPLKGWNSVTPDFEEWETTAKMGGEPGICIRFDVEKTPNLNYPDDKPISKYLPRIGRLKSLDRSPGYKDSPLYWSNERGFPPPEGLSKAIFTESAITAYDAYGKFVFTGRNFQILGMLDPARAGGDRPCLRFAKMGEVMGGGMGVQLGPPIILPVDAKSTNPIDFQIYEQARRECERVRLDGGLYSCPPGNLGVDATGAGAGLVDIFQRMWSPQVMRVIFSAAPSETPVSLEDARPAKDVYKNLRAEMFFRARNMLDSRQLKGFDVETVKELCGLEFETKAKIVLVAKEDYKLKYGSSPDLADTVAIMAEVARRKGLVLQALGQTVNRGEAHSKMAQETQEIYADQSFSASNEDDYQPEEVYA